MTDKPPSAYAISQVVGIWHRARAWLLDEDTDLQRDEAQIAELLGPETADVIDMLNRSLRAARHAESMVDAIKIQRAELEAREKRFAKRYETMKGAAFAIMQALDKRSHELPELTASIRKGASSVVILAPDAVEDRFMRIIPENKVPDKIKLREALTKDGEVLDYAVMSNAAPYISIGVK